MGAMDARANPVARKPSAAFVPAVLDFSVTDFCQADCDFCGFARSKMRGKPRRFADGADTAFTRDAKASLQRLKGKP